MDLLNQFILSHIDFGTLAILFCLMAVVAGFTELGYMETIAQGLVKRSGNQRMLQLSLVLSCFFLSMLVTNDVALIIIVPFTIQILHTVNRNEKLIVTVVLETIAANLGSMATPIGNPQNVYLYQTYHMNMLEFLLSVLPYVLVSALLLVCIVWMDKSGKASVDMQADSVGQQVIRHKRKGLKTAVYSLLFIVCLLTVLDVIPYYIMLPVVVLGIVLCSPRLLWQVDYGLLLKFVFLFILVGNLANISWISSHLDKLVAGNEFVTGIVLSQVLSNVPTAIMLSGFTEDGMELLQGVNVGGLGTLIASMASMISLEFYTKAVVADKKKYILTFTGYNLLFLAVLVLVKIIVYV